MRESGRWRGAFGGGRMACDPTKAADATLRRWRPYDVHRPPQRRNLTLPKGTSFGRNPSPIRRRVPYWLSKGCSAPSYGERGFRIWSHGSAPLHRRRTPRFADGVATRFRYSENPLCESLCFLCALCVEFALTASDSGRAPLADHHPQRRN